MVNNNNYYDEIVKKIIINELQIYVEIIQALIYKFNYKLDVKINNNI